MLETKAKEVIKREVNKLIPLELTSLPFTHADQGEVLPLIDSCFTFSEENEITPTGQGDVLIVNPINSSIVQEGKGYWQQRNIFHIEYISHAKVCNAFINSGNFEKVVPTKMVDILEQK